MKNLIVCIALLVAAAAYTPTAKADDILDVVVPPAFLGTYGPFGMSFTWDVTTGILSDVAFTGANGVVAPFANQFVYDPTVAYLLPLVPGGDIYDIEMFVPNQPGLVAELFDDVVPPLAPIVGSDQPVALDFGCYTMECADTELIGGLSFGRSVAIITQAPEPSTISMLLMGLGVLGIGILTLTRTRRSTTRSVKPDAILGGA